MYRSKCDCHVFADPFLLNFDRIANEFTYILTKDLLNMLVLTYQLECTLEQLELIIITCICKC